MATSDLGLTLRHAREASGLSRHTIAVRTKIAPRVLESLERNALNEVPGGLFRRGYVRAYAAEVGLDGDRVVREYLDPSSVDSDAEVLEQLRARHCASNRSRKNIVQLVLVIASLTCLLYLLTRRSPAISGDVLRDQEGPPASGVSLLFAPDRGSGAALDQRVSLSLRGLRL
jgi:cytoskeletal protein RodZ